MKNIAIFMSSTFNDMQSERDLMREKVTPEIAEALVGYGRSVEFIDLRWGIDTASVDENTANRKILRTCFEEIKNSEPFFIAFIGERYGWIPDFEDVVDALENEGIPTDGDISGKSVTELEIECAIRLNPIMEKCVFYFRDDIDYGGDAEHEQMFVARADERKKLNALKARIKKKYPERVRTYSAVWNADQSRIEGLDGLERQVIADINDIIVKSSGITADALDPISESINITDGVVDGLASSFSGREKERAEIRDFVLGWDRVLVLSGSSGSGKSALLAKTVDECKDLENTVVLPFFTGADERCGTAESMMELTCARAAHILGNDASVADGASLGQRFNAMLNKLALEKKVVLIVDAVNQFAATEYENKLKWLNLYALAENVKIIISATSDYYGLPFLRALGAKIRNLDYFSQSDVLAVSERYFSVNHKQPSKKLLAAIADKDDAPCRQPIYLLSLLQQLNNLGREDFAAIKDRERTGGESAADAIVNYLVDIVNKAPVTLSEQLDNLLNTAAVKVGEACRLFVSAIALSRRGITERLMQKICERLSVDYDGATFSYFRRMFKSDLCRRENGAWDFSHALIKAHYGSAVSASDRADIINAVIDCLDAEPDESEFKRSEYAFYLTAADKLDLFVPFFAQNDCDPTRYALMTELQALENAKKAQKLFVHSPYEESILQFIIDTIKSGAYSSQLAENYARYALNNIYADDGFASDKNKLGQVFDVYCALADVALGAGYYRIARDYLFLAKRVGEKCGSFIAEVYEKLARCYFALGAAIKCERYRKASVTAMEGEYAAGALRAEKLLDAYISFCEQKLQAVAVRKKAISTVLDKAEKLLDKVDNIEQKRVYAAKLLLVAADIGSSEYAELAELCKGGEDSSFTNYALGAYTFNSSVDGAIEYLNRAHSIAKSELQAQVNVKTLGLLEKIIELKSIAARIKGESDAELNAERADYLNTVILLEPSYAAASEYLDLSRDKSSAASRNAKTVRKRFSRGVSTAEQKTVNKILIIAMLAVGVAYMLVMPMLFSFLRGVIPIKRGASPFKVFAEFYVQSFLEAFFNVFLLFSVYGVMQIIKPTSDYAVRRVWIKRTAVFASTAVAIVCVYAAVWNYFRSIFMESFMHSFIVFELPYMFMLAMELLTVVLLADLILSLLMRELPSRSVKNNYRRFVSDYKRAMLGYIPNAVLLAVDVLGMWALYDWYAAISHYGYLMLGKTVFYAFAGITAAALVIKIVYLTVMYFVVGKRHGKNTAD